MMSIECQPSVRSLVPIIAEGFSFNSSEDARMPSNARIRDVFDLSKSSFSMQMDAVLKLKAVTR